MFDPRDRRTHPFFGGPGAAVGTQHGTRPPNVFVQSESSSDAERIFRVMNDNYHGRSWTRMKDCPRLRAMLSLLDAELEQILSVNKELRCQGSKCGGVPGSPQFSGSAFSCWQFLRITLKGGVFLPPIFHPHPHPPTVLSFLRRKRPYLSPPTPIATLMFESGRVPTGTGVSR